MNKISLFGGTGFIGGTFAEMYPQEVFLIDREKRDPVNKDVLYFISTTTNQSVFTDLHCDINTNLNLLMEVLSNCKDKDITFNFISSCFVYGNNVLDAKETDCCNPTGFYSITKRCAEQLLISFCKTFGIKYRILRIGNVYGSDKTISTGKNVLGYMTGLLKNNQDIKLYDGGNFLKDYIHVKDVCRAIKTILDKGELNQIYNIGYGNSITFRQIIEKIKAITNSKSNILTTSFPREQEFIQIKNMTLNINKLNSLGFKPSITLEEGLNDLCKNV